MRVPVIAGLAALATMLPSVMGDFHIIQANCLNYEFSKRDLEVRKGGGDKEPMNWHLTDNSQRSNLIPSQNYDDRCNYIAHNENTGYDSLPSDWFTVGKFCGEDLDFWKTDHNTWEVWRSNANPGVKLAECYADPSDFYCDLHTGLYRSSCSWHRSYVCPSSLCK
jgi:hypothetical protein